MRKDDNITSIMMLFTISAVIIGVSAADVPLQHTNAVSNDHNGMNGSCRQNHPSNTSKKCSKNDTPLILPFP
jgi:hypothetical protein